MRTIVGSFVCGTAIFMAAPIHAQQVEASSLLGRIKDANNAHAIGYDYTICNQHKRSGQQQGMLKGVLYKQDKNYLDSNSRYLSAVLNGYYCKLIFSEQSATVFEVAAFKKKVGIPMEEQAGGVIPVSDSLIRRYGKLSATESGGLYVIDLNMAAPYAMKLIIKAKKDDLRLVSIRMEMATEEGEASDYIKVYEMQHFKYKVEDRIFDYGRFFKLQPGNKIVLNGKYARYHLNTLTN